MEFLMRSTMFGRSRLPARYDRGSMLLRRRYAFDSTVWTPRRNCGTALTAMVTSAPIWITTSAGTGSDTPPSTRILPSRLTGHHSTGAALLARPARSRLPEPIATRSPMLWCPVKREGRILVDGGVSDPVPAEVVI